ncbi:MAG: hypothetical protein ACLP1X_07685 [Polyangiaceae bacterium]|jgi:hypothetical protein
MAGSKKKSKKPTRAKSAPKRAATGKPRTKSAKPAKRTGSVRVAAKKVPVRKPQVQAPVHAQPRSQKAFAEKVRDCDAGTGIWFVVAGSVEHAVIERRGSDGAVVIRTDAGAPETVSKGNLFETADEARAARYL